jgi:copper oxidase (laccase) domain-containing protein
MKNYKTYEILNDLNIKNAFIGKPYDFSNKNTQRINDVSMLLDIPTGRVYECVQTHSSNIEIVCENDSQDNSKFNNVDGLLTNIRGVSLLIKVADCQGIFLYDPVKKVIG